MRYFSGCNGFNFIRFERKKSIFKAKRIFPLTGLLERKSLSLYLNYGRTTCIKLFIYFLVIKYSAAQLTPSWSVITTYNLLIELASGDNVTNENMSNALVQYSFNTSSA